MIPPFHQATLTSPLVFTSVKSELTLVGQELGEKYHWLRPKSLMEIPLLAKANIVLFPNERLPLTGNLTNYAPILKAIGLIEEHQTQDPPQKVLL